MYVKVVNYFSKYIYRFCLQGRIMNYCKTIYDCKITYSNGFNAVITFPNEK